MRIVLKPRAGGKTYELIQASAETGAVIVVTDYSQVQEIKKMAAAMGLEIPEPELFHRVLQGGKHIESGVLLDNADHWIERLFMEKARARVHAISVTPQIYTGIPEEIIQKALYQPVVSKEMARRIFFGEWNGEKDEEVSGA